MEIVNNYKYLGYTLTTKLSSNSACEEYVSKAKGIILDLMKTMWFLGSLNTTVFFQLCDAQIKPMLLYASEIWGTSRLRITESAHLFACKRLGVSWELLFLPHRLAFGASTERHQRVVIWDLVSLERKSTNLLLIPRTLFLVFSAR